MTEALEACLTEHASNVFSTSIKIITAMPLERKIMKNKFKMNQVVQLTSPAIGGDHGFFGSENIGQIGVVKEVSSDCVQVCIFSRKTIQVSGYPDQFMLIGERHMENTKTDSRLNIDNFDKSLVEQQASRMQNKSVGDIVQKVITDGEFSIEHHIGYVTGIKNNRPMVRFPNTTQSVMDKHNELWLIGAAFIRPPIEPSRSYGRELYYIEHAYRIYHPKQTGAILQHNVSLVGALKNLEKSIREHFKNYFEPSFDLMPVSETALRVSVKLRLTKKCNSIEEFSFALAAFRKEYWNASYDTNIQIHWPYVATP